MKKTKMRLKSRSSFRNIWKRNYTTPCNKIFGILLVMIINIITNKICLQTMGFHSKSIIIYVFVAYPCAVGWWKLDGGGATGSHKYRCSCARCSTGNVVWNATKADGNCNGYCPDATAVCAGWWNGCTCTWSLYVSFSGIFAKCVTSFMS